MALPAVHTPDQGGGCMAYLIRPSFRLQARPLRRTVSSSTYRVVVRPLAISLN